MLLAGDVWWVDDDGAVNGSGTQADPFRTIQEAANVAEASDIVQIREGVYREQVTPVNSGTADEPIIYQAFNGEEVTISGAETLGGWSQHQGQIYKANQAQSLGIGLDQVFVDGEMVHWARWPNTVDVSNPVWDLTSSITPTLGDDQYEISLTDADIPGDTSEWVGGYVHIANGRGWVHSTGQIEATSSGNEIDFDIAFQSSDPTRTPYLPADDNRYYLTGTFRALDSEGEWFRDSDGTLYLWQPGGGNPEASNVEYKVRDYAIDLSGRDHIVLDGIDIFSASLLTDESSDSITIANMDAQYVSHFDLYNGENGFLTDLLDETGIILMGSDHTLRDSTIAYSAGNGVYLQGSGHRIVDNTIHDVSYAGTDASGIYTKRSPTDPVTNVEIAYNTMYNSGRALIMLRYVQASSVHHNDLSGSLLQTNDGGAINSFGLQGPDENDGKGTVIAYNTIRDNYAFGDRDIYVFEDNDEEAIAAGIHLDNGTRNYVLHHNVISKSQTGLRLNTGTQDLNHKVFNNTVVGDTISFASSGAPGFQNATGVELRNNILVGRTFNQFGDWNANRSNYFITPAEREDTAILDDLFEDYGNDDLRLRGHSTARNYGSPLEPYTDVTDENPDVGAIAFDDELFLTGVGGDESLDNKAHKIDFESPTEIKAWWFDTLGEGVSYHDSSPFNQTLAASFGSIRSYEGVEVSGSGTLGWIKSGEWVKYALDLEVGGTYNLQFNGVSGQFVAADSIEVSVIDGDGERSLGTVSGGGTDRLEGITLNPGVQSIRLDFTGEFGFRGFTLENVQTPYVDHTLSPDVPLTVGAGDYDEGGQGIAYQDSDIVNRSLAAPFGSLRPEESVEVSGSGTLGWIKTGEWVEYTVNVEQAGNYDLSIDAITNQFQAGESITVTVADSEGVRTLGTIQGDGPDGLDGLSLRAGPQVFRLAFVGQFGIRDFTLENSQSAYVNHVLTHDTPLTVGAGDYDEGGEGIAYHDSDVVNRSLAAPFGSLRPEESIEVSGSGTLGWIKTGEWVEYTIDVQQAGTYQLAFDVVTNQFSSGDSITTQVTDSQGQRTLGVINGGGSNQIDVLTLNAGLQVIRLDFVGQFGIRDFTFENAQTAFADHVLSTGGSLTVAAGEYDQGGEGVAYHDFDSVNQSLAASFGSQRSEESVEVSGSGTLGWIKSGEWIEYTIEVEAAGTYDLSMNVISSQFGAGEAIRVKTTDSVGERTLGTVEGGGSNTLNGLVLNAGVQVIRLEFFGEFGLRDFTLDSV